MAIQNRFGDTENFDPNKMIRAEWAFPSDGYAYYCVAPGVVKKVVTAEEIQTILNASSEAYTALQALLADLENNPSEITNILNDIIALQNGKLDKTGDSKDNVVSFVVATVDADIATGEKQSTLFGKILKRFAVIALSISGIATSIGSLPTLLTTFKTNLVGAINELFANKIDKTSIVQNATTSDTTKVPSTVVTKSLQDQVNTITNKLVLSATEHIVDTDTDGKPIYSKTLTFNIGTGTTAQGSVVAVAGAIKMWIDVQNTFWLINGTTQIFTATFFTSSGLQAFCFCISNSICYSKPTSTLDLSLTVTVRYTK